MSVHAHLLALGGVDVQEGHHDDDPLLFHELPERVLLTWPSGEP